MKKVNNYIILINADGKEAQGGSGKSKGASDVEFIRKAKEFFKNFETMCDNTTCSKCRFDSSAEKDCFLQYLNELEGKINEG